MFPRRGGGHAGPGWLRPTRRRRDDPALVVYARWASHHISLRPLAPLTPPCPPPTPSQAHADQWPKDLRLPAARERELYLACASVLQACTRKPRTAAKEAYRLLIKCLATYEVRGAGDLGEIGLGFRVCMGRGCGAGWGGGSWVQGGRTGRGACLCRAGRLIGRAVPLPAAPCAQQPIDTLPTNVRFATPASPRRAPARRRLRPPSPPRRRRRWSLCAPRSCSSLTCWTTPRCARWPRTRSTPRSFSCSPSSCPAPSRCGPG